MFYTYLHINEQGVFYAGCGNEKRPWRHSPRPGIWKQAANVGYSVLILGEFEDQQEAWEHEKELIAYFKPLCNKAIGGPGPKGAVLSPELKAKRSWATKGERNPNYGKHHSPETREKIRLARAKQIITHETKLKMSLSHLGKKVTLETRSKMSKAQRGSKNPLSKLSEEQAKSIRNEVGTYKEIANRYGVSSKTIANIKLGKGWNHL